MSLLQNSLWYQVYNHEPTPTGPPTVRWLDLFATRRAGLIISEYPPAFWHSQLSQHNLAVENLAERFNANALPRQQAKELGDIWQTLCQNRAPPRQVELSVVLLPRLAHDQHKPFFDQLRAHVHGAHEQARQGLPAWLPLLVADYATHLALWRDEHAGDLSPLGKELVDNTWLLDSVANAQPFVNWLCGGDWAMLAFFERALAEVPPSDLPQALRVRVHELVAALLASAGEFAVEQRLRRLLQLPSTPELNGEHQAKRQRYLQRLAVFLPGKVDPKAADADYQWEEQRRAAAWHSFGLNLNDKNKQRACLWAGGLLRLAYTPRGTYFRLRNPLLLYVIAQIVRKERLDGHDLWQAHDPAVKTMLTDSFHGQVPPDTQSLWGKTQPHPDGLDRFLDTLIDKASSQAYVPDAWTLPPLSTHWLLPSHPPGAWWLRVAFA